MCHRLLAGAAAVLQPQTVTVPVEAPAPQPVPEEAPAVPPAIPVEVQSEAAVNPDGVALARENVAASLLIGPPVTAAAVASA